MEESLKIIKIAFILQVFITYTMILLVVYQIDFDKSSIFQIMMTLVLAVLLALTNFWILRLLEI